MRSSGERGLLDLLLPRAEVGVQQMKHADTRDKAQKILAGLLAIVMLGLAIAGGILNYSPVPQWDMWDGTLAFNVRLLEGDHSSWWMQHNEHRLVLSRVLFWLDYKAFGGLSVFLVMANYALILVSCYVFLTYLQHTKTEDAKHKHKKSVLWFVVVAWLFLWTQKDNMTWGFQSQALLAFLLPLIALFWAAKSSASSSWLDFSVACVFGVASAGTMANGVLCMPMLLLFFLIERQGTARNAVVALISTLVLGLYFYDYEAPAHHGSVTAAVVCDPFGFVHFAMSYLGSPFFSISGGGGIGRLSAPLVGVALVFLFGLLSRQQMKSKQSSPYVTALMVYLLYVVGAAFGTAGGRLIFGVDYALSSRYTTPAIMAWAAMAVAHLGSYSRVSRRYRKGLAIGVVILGILMLRYQLNALRNNESLLSARQTAALALALDIRDAEYIQKVYPEVDRVLEIAADARERSLSVFGTYPYENLHEEMGTRSGHGDAGGCLGEIENVKFIDGVDDHVRVHGWLFDPATQSHPELVRFVDNRGTIVGFALTGLPREDLTSVHDNAELSGFRGYLKRSATGHRLDLVGDDPHCMKDVNVPSSSLIGSRGRE